MKNMIKRFILGLSFKRSLKGPRLPAPCNNDKEHYYWVDMDWPCPICVGQETRRLEKARKDRELEQLATLIVEKLKGYDK